MTSPAPNTRLRLPARPRVENATRAQLNSAHFSRGDGYLVHRSRGTPTSLLFFTMAGRGFFRSTEGVVHLTAPGELVCYEPEVEQDYGTVPGEVWDFHYVHFHARLHWGRWLAFPPLPGLTGLGRLPIEAPDLRDEIERLWRRLDAHVERGNEWQRDLAMNRLEEILLLVGERRRTGRTPPLDGRVQGALYSMAREPGHRHSVATLAHAAGLSPSRFAHLFRRQTGRSVIEALVRTRLERAQALLETTDMRISEIAEVLGFASPQHFATRFARHAGVSPRAFRHRPVVE